MYGEGQDGVGKRYQSCMVKDRMEWGRGTSHVCGRTGWSGEEVPAMYGEGQDGVGKRYQPCMGKDRMEWGRDTSHVWGRTGWSGEEVPVHIAMTPHTV